MKILSRIQIELRTNSGKYAQTEANKSGKSHRKKRDVRKVVGAITRTMWSFPPKVNEIYRKNNHPKHNFLMDVREFLEIPNENLPPELFDLDVLDGSPPCTTFSMAGKREEGWGVEKNFREGQKKQRLDDLFFTFIAIAEKLQPKIVVAENVRGLVTGNAKGYVREIIKGFKDAGYSVQIFLLSAISMGVPQVRERVFFIAKRDDLECGKLMLKFDEPPIKFGEVRTEHGIPFKRGDLYKKLLENRSPSDKTMSDISVRVRGKNSGFNNNITSDDQVAQTIVSGASFIRMFDGENYSNEDYRNVQTFPQDYDFGNQSPHYVCGMSVPPVMMAQISKQIQLQWLDRLIK